MEGRGGHNRPAQVSCVDILRVDDRDAARHRRGMSLASLLAHEGVSETLRTAAACSAGARFFRCALQVNPFEYARRHPKGGGPSHADEESYNAAMVAAARTAGVEVVALTDHSRAETSEGLRRAFMKANIAVFPGFEATSQDGVHLLCLFDPATDVAQITAIVGFCGVTCFNDPSPCARKYCNEIIEIVAERDGLVVAAHACSAGGILKHLKGTARATPWQNPRLLAAALPGPAEDAPHGVRDILLNRDAAHKRSRPVAVVNASDVSAPADFAKPSSTCLIKMSDPTVDGLRQAFLAADSRIRLNAEGLQEDSAEIAAIAWDGGFLDGQALRLNNGLNVLVGGRGAGKSALIESIRFAFGYSIRGKDARATHRAIVEKVLGSATKVSVLLREGPPARNHYVVERTVPHPPLVRGPDGEVIEGLEPMRLIEDLEIFGQHELSELTRDKEELAAILRRYEADGAEAQERRDAAARKLKDSHDSILALLKRIDDLRERTAALPELQLRVSRMQAARVQEKLEGKVAFHEELQRVGEARASLEAVRAAAEGVARDLRGVDRQGLPPDVLELLAATEREAGPLAGRLTSSLAEGVARIDERLAEREAHRGAVDAEHARVEEELRAEGIEPNDYLKTTTQIRVLKGEKAELAEAEEELEALRADRSVLLREWNEMQAARLRSSKDAARKAGKALSGRVRVRVERTRNLSPIRDAFDEAIEGQGSKAAMDRLEARDDLSLTELAAAIRRGATALREEYSFTPNAAEKVAGGGEALALRIEALALGPAAEVELNVGEEGSERWKSIADLSAGQRATAVLLLLLGGSASPLVLDQPEDDLDNRFITETVVTVMREEKRRRQFVFSSHNANIPVLADAEQIVHLRPEVEDGRERTTIPQGETGSIDRPMVRRVVETLLEGGREAFELRRAKYGY